MAYEARTSLSFDDAVEALRTTARMRGVEILNELDFTEFLGRHGVAVGTRMLVCDVCKPALVGEVLASNPALVAALPCRIAVREVANGAIYSCMLLGDLARAAGLAPIPASVEKMTRGLVGLIDEAAQMRISRV